MTILEGLYVTKLSYTLEPGLEEILVAVNMLLAVSLLNGSYKYMRKVAGDD